MRTLLLIGCFLASLALAGCGGDDVLDAVRAHPLATPTLSFGEVKHQYSGSGDTSTGLSPARIDTRASTTFEVPPERVGEAFQELKQDVEALGYELRPVNGTSNRIRSGEIDAFPGTAVAIWHTEQTVVLEVIGLRNN